MHGQRLGDGDGGRWLVHIPSTTGLWNMHLGAPGILGSLAIILPKVSLINGEGGFPNVLEVRVHGFAHGVAGRTGGTWQAIFDPPRLPWEDQPQEAPSRPFQSRSAEGQQKRQEKKREWQVLIHIAPACGWGEVCQDWWVAPARTGKSKLARAE